MEINCLLCKSQVSDCFYVHVPNFLAVADDNFSFLIDNTLPELQERVCSLECLEYHVFQGKQYIIATKAYFVCPEEADAALFPPHDLGASAGFLEMNTQKTTAEKQTAPSSLHTYWL